ncbi:MAG: right-handed parallel beta-helix repeat-containing protein [Christensenellaceae bacterium]|jgi:hypothetical protein|nr:right-handed parallel beta-helix repeat-containing protein [Christensenellaceae bacterium]
MGVSKIKYITILLVFIILLSAIFFSACNKEQQVTFEIPEIPDLTPSRTVTATKVVSYAGPSFIRSSSKLDVQLEGHNLYVYETRINNRRNFSYSTPLTTASVVLFDFEGSANMMVTANDASSVSNAILRPAAYGINPIAVGNKIIFRLKYSGEYTLEYKANVAGSLETKVLHIFAHELETNPIKADSIPSDTIYLGPGIYDAGTIPIKSNQTLYLAGGSFIFGQIRAEFAENITIRGRGILGGSVYEKATVAQSAIPIEFKDCKNVLIEGITILDPAGSAIELINSSNVAINDVNIITARADSPGIVVQSSSEITVSDCFIRSWGDSLIVRSKNGISTSNVIFENIVLWTDLEQSCEIGYEADAATISNITFRDITILHSYHKASLSVHSADRANVFDIYFLNITIEDASILGEFANDFSDDFVIDLRIARDSDLSMSDSRGPISNIIFSNVNILSTLENITIRMNGENDTATINDVFFNNLYFNGKHITALTDVSLAPNAFSSSPYFTSQGDYTNGARIRYPYISAIRTSSVNFNSVPAITQAGVEVPSFAVISTNTPFSGSKIPYPSSTEITLLHASGFENSVTDDGLWNVDNIANLADNDTTTPWISPAWCGTKDEYVAITMDFFADGDENDQGADFITPGMIRIYFDPNNELSVEYRLRLYNKNYTSESFSFIKDIYCKASPASGNYFDIRLPYIESNEFQIRIYRNSGLLSKSELIINELELYPVAITTNRPIKYVNDYNNIYVPDYLTDGNINTYWESTTANGAFFIIQLDDDRSQYLITDIVLHLPPQQIWVSRSEWIQIFTSINDLSDYYPLSQTTEYRFDPATGNTVHIHFDEPISAALLKFEFSANSEEEYGAQLSELFVFGTQV